MTKYLTKENELHLGGLIQAMVKAQEEIEEIALAGSGPTPVMEVAEKHSETIRIGNLAVEKLVSFNVGLVYKLAQGFKSRYPAAPDLEDLVQEGMLGLMKAVRKYDPAQGNKFSTMAYPWITQAIGRGTNTTGRLVRLPENRVSDFIAVSRIRSELEGSGLTSGEVNKLVMAEIGLTWGELVSITNAAATPASLNKVVGDSDGSAKELMEYVSQNVPTVSSEEVVVKTEIFNILNEKIEDMDVISRDVISAAFMLDAAADSDSKKSDLKKAVRDRHNLSAPKFKRILTESLEILSADLKGLGIGFEDFLDA